MSNQIEGYFISNQILYKAGDGEEEQLQATKAISTAAALIQKNEDACDKVKARDNQLDYCLGSSHNNSWFWLNMYVLTTPPDGGLGVGCCGGCSGGGSGSEALLIIAIVALAIAILISLGFTIYQSAKAENTRKNITEVENLLGSASIQEVKEAYQTMHEILKDEHVDQSLQATFTATIMAGLGLLTVSAAFALYAVLHNIGCSSWTKIFAIAGGATTGAGLLAHCIRPIVQNCRQEKHLQKYNNLIDQIEKLNPLLLHPYEVFKEVQEAKAYFVFQKNIFAKNEAHYSRYQDSEAQRKILTADGFVLKELKNKA
jgi:hypothetical protein